MRRSYPFGEFELEDVPMMGCYMSRIVVDEDSVAKEFGDKYVLVTEKDTDYSWK